MQHPNSPALEETEKYLKEHPGAFYNHPKLLQEIREFVREKIEFDAETEENTKRNGEYTTCRIIYEMKKQKKRKIFSKEHVPARVKFSLDLKTTPPLLLAEHRKHSPLPANTPRSILKPSLPHRDERYPRKHPVYIAPLEEENAAPPFAFFSFLEKPKEGDNSVPSANK